MTQTIDLINAIDAGQSLKIHSIFEELINSRLVEAIEQRRAEIADLVFNGPIVEEAQLDEEFVQEMSQYDIKDVLEFMLSEDFVSLDELSKTALGSYVKKAVCRQLGRKEMQSYHYNNREKKALAGDVEGSKEAHDNYKKTLKKIVKTDSSINKAVDRLVK